ncbi:MAG: 1-deoxy-D-xylulose-5-phosphate synthase [Clostridia bacterium]|nr:1-deoxy-D-xylulose-5-phosphate synthase [Clostridia bacterium]
MLQHIDSPSDVKKLNNKELKILADEIREFLIHNVSKTGGHLASNLGVVELTIAIHKVFNSPEDKIVWDVGHQSYVHKILTGRKDKFETLRQYGGLSGFPRSSESEHDVFDAGHASNSISAALGYACARDLNNQKNSVVAVIGDGALSGGLSYEGLNNALQLKTNFIVILNDNQMSISKNVGGMSKYLTKLRTNPRYVKTKKGVLSTLNKIPVVGTPISKIIRSIKAIFRHLVLKTPLFDELGFTCIGPIDGHNIEDISEVLERAKNIKGPVMIHAYTTKGKGYTFAEENPSKFHGISKFDEETGLSINKSSASISPSKVFGNKLIEIAEKNNKVVAITAAMPDGTGLTEFSNKFPDRFYDVGIAEGHAVTFAGGMAKGGMVPVVAIYSTFLQRAYDNIYHDLILQKAHVVLAIDRAGLVGEDGETHHGMFDLSYLSSLPEIAILTPSSSSQLEEMLDYAVNNYNGPIAIRYPKIFNTDYKTKQPFAFGKSVVEMEGTDITVVAEGNMLIHALEAAKLSKHSVEVIDARTIKPVDSKTILDSYNKTGKIITIEDNTTSGGFGSMVENALGISVNKIGYKDKLVTHGDLNTLYKENNIDAQSIADEIERMCNT